MDYIVEKVRSCYQSRLKDGSNLIYSGSEWECRFWTEELLNNQLKDGKVVNSGVVGGKL